MIYYRPDKYQFKFIFQTRGSVTKGAAIWAISACVVALVWKLGLDAYCNEQGRVCYGPASDLPAILKLTSNSSVYTGFTFVVGFLLVFRTSQAYGRYVEGSTLLHMMRGEWYDACSSLVAFTYQSKDQERAEDLRHIMVRLFSLLHGCALQEIAELEDEDFSLLDVSGIDKDSLAYIDYCQKQRIPVVDVVFQWIQCLATANISSGLLPVPPPILSRAYQELAQGMVNFNNALKIKDTPFPFPYAQMITILLIVHWFLTPVVVVTSTYHWFWCCVFAFASVFCFWCVNFIAAEIENPFGDDVNDLPIVEMQSQMNTQLLILLDRRSCRVPQLASAAQRDLSRLLMRRQKSLNQAMAFCKGISSTRTSQNLDDILNKVDALEEVNVEVENESQEPQSPGNEDQDGDGWPDVCPNEPPPVVPEKQITTPRPTSGEPESGLELRQMASHTNELLLRLESLQQLQLEELKALAKMAQDFDGGRQAGRPALNIAGMLIPKSELSEGCVDSATIKRASMLIHHQESIHVASKQGQNAHELNS